MTRTENFADRPIDSAAAYRAARARGMAERSRLAHRMLGAAARTVRDLFGRPRPAGRGDWTV